MFGNIAESFSTCFPPRTAMKLRLNLSTTPQENQRPFIAGAVVVGTIALLALLILSHAAYASWQSNRDLRTDIAHWQQQIRVDSQKQRLLAANFNTPAAKQVMDRSTFLNALIDERSFPWTRIFMDLEKTIPSGVRVINITPRLVNGRAEVSMEVGLADSDSEIEFLHSMERSPVFSGLRVDQVRPVIQVVGAAVGPDRIVLNLTVRYTTI
jgi:hypothetical protein